MAWLRKIIFRLQPLFMKKRIEAELTDEIRTHLEMQTEANIAAGMSPDEARFAAQRQFGGTDQIKERFRDERGLPWIEDLLQDVRFAMRQLRKAPGFATIAILTVAIGIGACAAIFSIVNGVLLRPLEFPQPDRLVWLSATSTSTATPLFSVTPGDYLDWNRQASVFAHLSATRLTSYSSTATDSAVNVHARNVTANYFAVLGVQPTLGRAFLPEEETAGKDHVVILNYQFWQDQFGGRDNVINETIRLNDETYTIVGVMRHLPSISWNTDIFTPLVFSTADKADYFSRNLWVTGRLKPDSSVQQAQSEMNVISERIARLHPDSNKGRYARVTLLAQAFASGVRLQLLVLLGAVGSLLLIACANVASLLLARANSRQKEISVRAALGASRGRIVRQFICESLVIVVAGGSLGVLIAYGSMGALVRFASHFVPRMEDCSLDGRVLVLTFILVLLAGVGLGLVPGLQSTRGDTVESLKESNRGSSGGPKARRLRAVLVAVEIALALMLLSGTGLLVRSLTAMQESDEGFKTDNVYAEAFLLPPGNRYDTPQKIASFVSKGLERLSALPDVRSVAFTVGLPMGGKIKELPFDVAGKPQVATADLPQADVFTITPDYLKVMNIPLLRGRGLTAQDADAAPHVVLINREMAEKYLPNENPIGQHIRVVTLAGTPDVWSEVVGVVGDVRSYGPQSPIGPQIYEPIAQQPESNMTLLVQAKRPTAVLFVEIHDIFKSMDPSVPFPAIFPYEAAVAYSWVQQRFSVVLFTLFSSVALLLAAIGIYGVMAYSVNQRTGEIGIRMALGAQTGDVLQLILGSGAKIVGMGLLIGMAGSLAFTRLLSSLLYDTSPNDPLTLTAVGLLLALVAFLACWFPAHRATKIDPVVALRAE